MLNWCVSFQNFNNEFQAIGVFVRPCATFRKCLRAKSVNIVYDQFSLLIACCRFIWSRRLIVVPRNSNIKCSSGVPFQGSVIFAMKPIRKVTAVNYAAVKDTRFESFIFSRSELPSFRLAMKNTVIKSAYLFQVSHEVISYKCDCKFVWCCKLECSDCLQHRWVSTCNT